MNKKKLCIGTANFLQKYGLKNNQNLSHNEIKKIISFCKKKSINFIDTAQNYGKSEKIIGKLGYSNQKIITKININNYNLNNIDQIKKKLSIDINRTLFNLNTKNIYAVLIHNIDLENLNLNKLNNLKNVFQYMIKKKLILKYGFSIYYPDKINFFIKYFRPQIVQIPYSIFDRRFEKDNILEKISKKNIEIHARSIFLQGVLLDKKIQVKYFNKWNKVFKNFQKYLNKNNLSALEACINFVAKNKNIDKIVIGVDTLSQLKKIANIKTNNNFKIIKNPFTTDHKLLIPMLWKKQK